MTANLHKPRSSRIDALFPHGVPGLWCNLLTHFTAEGDIDLPRISAHLRFVREHVKGVVLLADIDANDRPLAEQLQRVVAMALQNLRKNREFLWISAPAPVAVQTWRASQSHTTDTSLAGLHVTLPQARQLEQAQLKAMLDEILKADFPACIQLPDGQATNRLTPDTLAALATDHENLLAFCEADARDGIVQSRLLPAGLFRLRSCENHYTTSLASTGGPYHGLLLASANVFPQQLAQLVLDPALGQWEASRTISDKLASVMAAAIELAKALAPDDVLMLALRAMDHHMAHGAAASDALPPHGPGGQPLPASLIQAMDELLARHELLPSHGYLHSEA